MGVEIRGSWVAPCSGDGEALGGSSGHRGEDADVVMGLKGIYAIKQSQAKRFKDYVDTVNSALADISVSNPTLQRAIERALLTGGKRIRPVLTLLSCEAVGGDHKCAIPIAVAYELAHSASLVQDDMIDRSDTRRGVPSIHMDFGPCTAMITADFLIFEIFKKLAEYGRRDFDPKRLNMLLNLIGDAAKATALGEHLEMELSRTNHVTAEEYLEIVRLKTGFLMASATASGAVVGMGSDYQIHALKSFGMSLGVSYQLQDDLLDIFGQAGEIGKPLFMDFKNGVSNLVMIHALNNSDETVRNYLTSLMGKPVPQTKMPYIRRLLRRLGSIDFAIIEASRIAKEGRVELLKLKPSPARQKLLELSYSTERARFFAIR